MAGFENSLMPAPSTVSASGPRGGHATATSWDDVRSLIEHAELFWISTVRTDSRPHVTPLPAVWHDNAIHFCTGPGEQKAVNLSGNANCTLTTGTNAWAEGLDVVVEGTAVRITDRDTLQSVADAVESKYGSVWHFEVGDGVFGEHQG